MERNDSGRYVQARLADAFGMEDVERWEASVTAETVGSSWGPWLRDGMDRYLRIVARTLSCTSFDYNAGVVATCLTPLEAHGLPKTVPRDQTRAFAADILMRSLNERARVFVAEEFDLALIWNAMPYFPSGFLVIRSDPKPLARGLILDPMTEEDVLRFLMSEVIHARPRAAEAFQELRKTLRDAILTERHAAVRDFQRGVAVSDDGTRIVRAKSVLVVSEGWTSARLYDGRGFTENKIGIPAGPESATGYRGRFDTAGLCAQFMTEHQRRTRLPDGFDVIQHWNGHAEPEQIYVVTDHTLLPAQLPQDATPINI